ncbi:MAG: glycosyltransferase [Chloroflexi bacterium]|nr:glycosyltransferase [Chloroflexota bacterium]
MTGDAARPRPTTIPQRLAIVLPSTGEFDSRTYRIARTCAARGHTVTVLARSGPGLADDEMTSDGYRIIRVTAVPVDALPLAPFWRRVRARRRRPSAGQPGKPTGADGEQPSNAAVAAGRRGLVGRLRRAIRGATRLAAIVLTDRAQTKASRAVDPGADLYHGMAYMGIPVALDLARRHRAAVTYDARDIYLEARNLARMSGPARRLLAWIERRWAHAANRVVTVNQAYAEVLRDRLRVPLPLIVMNCSERYNPPDPPVRRFHDQLGVAPDRPVILYHGGLFPDRGIEQLITAIGAVPDAELVLMGYGALETELPRLIAAGPAPDRVHVLAAVPPDQLHDWVAAADVVAMPIQPSTLNHRLTTPNKLFEAMAAGVPVVASDLPGMATIVTGTGCGELCDPADPESIAAAIRSILDASLDGREAYGVRGRRAAAETYNWEAQAAVLLEEYGRLTGRPW